jgi:hypothetical protein
VGLQQREQPQHPGARRGARFPRSHGPTGAGATTDPATDTTDTADTTATTATTATADTADTASASTDTRTRTRTGTGTGTGSLVAWASDRHATRMPAIAARMWPQCGLAFRA